MKSLFETLGGTYTLGADDMYYPNLTVPDTETARYGKYGRMRKTYLQEHRKALYSSLLMSGNLIPHLNEIDDTARSRMEHLTEQMAEMQHIDEALKARDQMAWVGAMNNICHSAEEIVLRELIYA